MVGETIGADAGDLTPDAISLSSMPWPAVPASPLVLVPIGSTEQHGPHLPFDTDTVIAAAVAAGAGSRMRAAGSAVVVPPALAYGASGEHQSFPGTVSMGQEALRFVLIELVRSLSTWAARVVFVNGHGGNVATLAAAVPQLVGEGHAVAWLPCAASAGAGSAAGDEVGVPVGDAVSAADAAAGVDVPVGDAVSAAEAAAGAAAGTSTGAAGDGSAARVPADAHAGRTETSLMLHLAPAAVILPLPGAGNTAPMSELFARMTAGGVGAVSLSGILGDPTGASAEEGAALLGAMIADAVSRIETGVADKRGMLRLFEPVPPAGARG
jgi:creatinine amidohydrolase